jgi:hypothetical protein
VRETGEPVPEERAYCAAGTEQDDFLHHGTAVIRCVETRKSTPRRS